MKFKKEYIILAVIILSLAVYLAVRSKNPTGFELPQPQAIEKSKINRILIVKGDEKIELAQKDEQWVLEPKGYPADSIKVGNMLDSAAELTLTALVSDSGNYERYDLTDEKRIQVKAFVEGRTAREFDIGRAAPTYQHTFVKLAGDKNVYHARGSIKNTFEHSLDSLRDKTVLSFEKDSMRSLTIQKDGQTVSLARKQVEQASEAKEQPADGETAAKQAQAAEPEPTAETKTQWLNAAGEKVEQTAVNGLLSALSGLKCDEFMADEAGKELTQEKWRLTFGGDQKEYSITTFAVSNEEDTTVPAISSATKYAFRLPQARVQTIEQEMDKLLKRDKTAKADQVAPKQTEK